jgi:hypothetical protein
VKPNLCFDDHLYASLCRDAGSNRRADALLERLRVSSPAHARPPPLLQLSCDAEKPLAATPELAGLAPLHSFTATYIKADVEKPCTLCVFADRVVLVHASTSRTKVLAAADVASIQCRSILHRPRGLELFAAAPSRSFLLAFDVPASDVLAAIAAQRRWAPALLADATATAAATRRWASRETSTFEYLLWLNASSGRSFNDTRMYPVFPWVVREYGAAELDLGDRAVYRDFGRPMAALGPERLAQLKTRCLPPADGLRRRYLFSSGYSSPLCIFIWLVRVEPFTSMHIRAQSGRFDVPARLFTSVAAAFELASSAIGDYRELIPEFFYDPLFLLNTNRFNLGEIRGEPLNDVELPPWAHGSAAEFVYINRKALESEIASAEIHKWFDLIWGYKQAGEEAERADNMFYPHLYEDVWDDPALAQNEEARAQVEATLDSCGQIPRQLFRDPHVPRDPECRHRLLTAPTVLQVARAAVIGVAGATIICRRGREVVSIGVEFRERNTPVVRETVWKVVMRPFRFVVKLSRSQIAAVFKSGDLAVMSAAGVQTCEVGVATCLSGDGELVCVGKADTAMCIARRAVVLETFPTFRSEVICSATSAAFDLVVVGARPSALFLAAPSHRSITRVLDLEDRNPVLVLITEGWRFIVVYEAGGPAPDGHFIELFTVNGDLVRRVEVPYVIRNWSTSKSRPRFDYLAIVPAVGAIRVCEAFFLVFHLLPETSVGVKSVFYSPELELFFIEHTHAVLSINRMVSAFREQ